MEEKENKIKKISTLHFFTYQDIIKEKIQMIQKFPQIPTIT